SSWPAKMLSQKFYRTLPVDAVRTIEKLDARAVPNAGLIIIAANLGVFVSDPLVKPDSVTMTALDHKRPRRNHHGHLGMAGHVRQVKFVHLVLHTEHVTVGQIGRGELANPLVEIAGADRKRVSLFERRNSQRGLASVGEAVECDTLRVHVR